MTFARALVNAGRARSVGLAIAMLSLVACGEDAPQHETPAREPTAADPAPDTASRASEHHDEEATEGPPATLVRYTGEVVIDHGALREGAPLERGAHVTVSEGGEAVIDIAGGDRATLFGPATAMIGDGAAHVVLARGSAHLVLPPGPAGPRPPFRIATREASAEMVGGGELFVVENAAGATWVVCLSGLARVENGEVDARHHARTTELNGGQAVLVVDHPAEPTEAPARLADARAAADAIFAGLTPPDDARRGSALARAGTDLDAALGWLEAEARRGHELTEQHRAAVTGGRREEAMRLQGELVGHAQQLHALRDAATARWERLVARVVAGEVAPGAPDPAAARRERALALLGFE